MRQCVICKQVRIHVHLYSCFIEFIEQVKDKIENANLIEHFIVFSQRIWYNKLLYSLYAWLLRPILVRVVTCTFISLSDAAP